MKKFLVLYKAPVESFEKMMRNVTPEQQQQGMDAWEKWGKQAKKSIVDMGAPLGKALRVEQSGQEAVRNDLGGYSIMQADSKEQLAKELSGHPHFMMPDGFIEVTEIMPMPTA